MHLLNLFASGGGGAMQFLEISPTQRRRGGGGKCKLMAAEGVTFSFLFWWALGVEQRKESPIGAFAARRCSSYRFSSIMSVAILPKKRKEGEEMKLRTRRTPLVYFK